MNLPNCLTLSRIFFSFVLIYALLQPGHVYKGVALICFSLGAITDFLDGFLARRWKLITPFGILMDPIADKLLVLSAFIVFVQLQILPTWMVVLIALRELLITGIRLFAKGQGHVLAAESAGKLKTVAQMLFIFCVLVIMVAHEFAYFESGGQIVPWGLFAKQCIYYTAWGVVGITLYSGYSFLKQNYKTIFNF